MHVGQRCSYLNGSKRQDAIITGVAHAPFVLFVALVDRPHRKRFKALPQGFALHNEFARVVDQRTA